MTDKNHLNDRVENLIARSVSGNASPDEIQLLENWKSESGENLQIYQESLKVWENSKHRISEGEIDQDKNRILFEIHRELHAQVQKARRASNIFKIAAIVGIPLTFAISWYLLQNDSRPQTAQICSVIAPKGHISKCVLPDGTEVWVNTGSSITYNTSTFNHTEREVNLNGEAYFQVKKNTKRPFRVMTPDANLNVTGTSFNVKSFPGSGVFETVLDEGSIHLELNLKSNQEFKLVPGDRAVFDSKQNKTVIAKVETEMYSSWRNGEIIFKDATLNDLVRELERIYEISFRFKNENLGKYRFRGMFSYNNNLINALEKIKKTSGIKYYIENKEVWLTK